MIEYPVLLAEGDAPLRASINTTLTQACYRVVEAATAPEAIHYLLANTEPHIAFLDCHLPVEGAGELFQALAPLLAKAMAHHSFVLMTGNLDMQCAIADLAMDQRYVQILLKPFMPNDVEKAASNATHYLAGKTAAASEAATGETLEALAGDQAPGDADVSSHRSQPFGTQHEGAGGGASGQDIGFGE